MRAKVLIIHPYLHRSGGTGADGVRQVILTHLSCANWDEFEYTVAVPALNVHVNEYRALGPVEILELSAGDHLVLRRTRNPIYYMRYAANLPFQVGKLVRHIRRNKIDIVHSHASSFLGGAIAARLGRVPNIVHIHEGVERIPGPLANAYTRLTIGIADRIIASSRHSAERLNAFGAEGKVSLIYNGVNIERFKPNLPPLDLGQRYRIPSDHLVIGYVGRMHPRKDLVLLIEAFARVWARMPNTTLLLVAAVDDAVSAEYARKVRQRVKDLGVESHVVIDQGSVTNLPSLYRALSLTLYSAPFDYLPMAILESLAAGVPVVIASEGGPREAVVDGEHGRQVPVSDRDTLSAAILELLADPGLRRRMGHEARKRAVSVFKNADFAENVESLYRNVMEFSSSAKLSKLHTS